MAALLLLKFDTLFRFWNKSRHHFRQKFRWNINCTFFDLGSLQRNYWLLFLSIFFYLIEYFLRHLLMLKFFYCRQDIFSKHELHLILGIIRLIFLLQFLSKISFIVLWNFFIEFLRLVIFRSFWFVAMLLTRLNIHI